MTGARLQVWTRLHATRTAAWNGSCDCVVGRDQKEAIVSRIEWLKDVDEGIARAKGTGKPVLLDFSAAPM